MFGDLTLVSMLKTRLHWQQTRQKLLAENVANANMPGFKPKDLRPLTTPNGASGVAPVAMATTNPLHLAALGGASAADQVGANRFETLPNGNAVNLEDEMLKAAENQSDYALAASLYQKSLGLLRTAAGGKSSA